MPLSSTQLSLTDLLGPVLGPLDWSSTRGLRQGIYSGVKCNGLHATKLVTSRHLPRDRLLWVACYQIGDESPFVQEPHGVVRMAGRQSLFFWQVFWTKAVIRYILDLE